MGKDLGKLGVYSALANAAATLLFILAGSWLRGRLRVSEDDLRIAQGALAVLLGPVFMVIGAVVMHYLKRRLDLTVGVLALAIPVAAEAAPTGSIPITMRQVGTGTAAYEVAELKIAPMVIVNAIAIPLDRRAQFEAGVDVGGCYALHYSPAWWDEVDDDPFASIGLCFEAGLVIGADLPGGEGPNHLAIQPGVALSLARWIAVGFAYRYRLSLSDGGLDNGSPVLTLGLTAATF